MRNRERQRRNREKKRQRENIGKRNEYGNKDLTAYNAIRQIETDGESIIVLK